MASACEADDPLGNFLSNVAGNFGKFCHQRQPGDTQGPRPILNTTMLLRNGHGESVHKAHTSDHFGPLPNGDGGGRGGRGLSVHRRGSVLLMIALDCTFFSDRARSKCHRQTVQVQSVLGNVRSVRCAMQ